MSSRLLAPNPPAASDDDRSLLRRFARTGDDAAFAALVDRHGPLVLGVCRRVLRDPHAADDAFQAVFLVLARKANRVRVGASLGSWLFGVARRVSLAARRKQSRMRNAELGVRNQNPVTAAPPAEWDDLLRTLDEELARLPDRLRAPVLECFLREKTQDEAAKALGWSLSTVRRRLDRAKELLRARLTARGAGLAAVLSAGAVAGTAAAAVPPELAKAAVQVAVAGRVGGAVGAGIGALAGKGVGMSAAVKAGLGLAVACGVGVGAWRAAGFNPAVEAPPPTAVAATEPPKSVEVPRVVEVPKLVAPPATRPTDGGVEPRRSPEPPKPVAPPPAFTPPPVHSEWVTIRGRIMLSNIPEPRKIDATTDREFCAKDGPVVDESLIVGKTGGVKNVVVWLRPDSPDRRAEFPRDKINPALANAGPATRVIDQPCCQFEPRIMAAKAGDKLIVRNSARVAHNTNMSGGDENPALVFNINLPPGGSHEPAGAMAAQRTPIPLKCDIHPWMKGFIRVFDHPYFAVTDDDGNFTIPDAPAGTWRLVVWHEGGFHRGREGVLGMPVELRGGTVELRPIELELPKP